MKIRRLRTNSSGMTLVELVVALVLTGLIVGVVMDFSIAKLRQSSVESIKNSLLSNAETGLDRVANDIRLATHADGNNRWQDNFAPGAPGNLLSWQSNSTTLVLAIAAQDSSGGILFDDAHDYVTTKNNVIYYLQDGSLYRRILAAPVSSNAAVTTCPSPDASSSCPADALVLQNVSSLTIRYFDGTNQQVDPADARSVELAITLKVHKFGQDLTASYTTRMVFRNA